MSVAGVAMGDGSRLWVESYGLQLRPLDAVKVRVDGREAKATVLITPEQIVRGNPATAGSILEVVRPAPAVHRDILPGSDMPYLDADVRVAGMSGTVVAIDPVTESVTVQVDGRTLTVSRGEVESEV